jgi:Peptidase M15
MFNWIKAALCVPFCVVALMSPADAYSGKSSGLNPRLRYLLQKIETHFHGPLTVTSGCRSHSHNRRIGGARESWHLRCMAADVKISGVNKYSIAKFASGLSGRGGIGTYCYDGSIHLDVGPRRNWYWCGARRSFSQGNIHRTTFRVLHRKRSKHRRRH